MTRLPYSTEPEADVVKTKKSELRLTCDLLMKQVYNVKTAANNPDGPDLEVDNTFFCHTHIFPSLIVKKEGTGYMPNILLSSSLFTFSFPVKNYIEQSVIS